MDLRCLLKLVDWPNGVQLVLWPRSCEGEIGEQLSGFGKTPKIIRGSQKGELGK